MKLRGKAKNQRLGPWLEQNEIPVTTLGDTLVDHG